MLRQLARLTAPVPVAGPRACAIAVYANAEDSTLAAADAGREGVACVDDAARAVVLLCDLWDATRLPLARAWARSLVDFLHHMQLPDGRFVNFIIDWDGARNEHGRTSFPGGGFWQARGVRGLAKAWLSLGDARARAGMRRGLDVIREARDVPADVRAIHAETVIELLRQGRMPELRGDLERWADELAACRAGEVLLDHPGQNEPHLWGHIQEGVLADASVVLGRDDLLAIARASALAYLRPRIESGFDLPAVEPYGVASAAFGMDRLAAATNEPLFADLGREARAWFHGRNPAGLPVYAAGSGRIQDGIDGRVMNAHAGAESNIVGAQALIDEVIATIPAWLPVVEATFSASVRRRIGVIPAERTA